MTQPTARQMSGETDKISMDVVVTLSRSLGQVTSQLEAMRKENRSLRLRLQRAETALARAQPEKR